MADDLAAAFERARHAGEPDRSPAPSAVRAAPAGGDGRLRIAALGPTDFTFRGRQIIPRGHERSWQMLILLACHRPGALNKEQLVEAIWPDEDLDPETANGRFHRVLHDLRRLLSRLCPGLDNDAIMAVGDGTYRLNPAQVYSNVQDYLHSADTARDPASSLDDAIRAYHHARALWTGELCRGITAEWLDPAGDQRLVDQYAKLLDQRLTRRLAGRACKEGRWADARFLYGNILDEDPTNEEIVRQVMTCAARMGDTNGIISAELDLKVALEQQCGLGEEMGDASLLTEVSPATRRHREALLRELRGQEGEEVRDSRARALLATPGD
jgi:DNA-binding SARP family transcriptional activator